MLSVKINKMLLCLDVYVTFFVDIKEMVNDGTMKTVDWGLAILGIRLVICAINNNKSLSILLQYNNSMTVIRFWIHNV